jgi:hypothetical protein
MKHESASLVVFLLFLLVAGVYERGCDASVDGHHLKIDAHPSQGCGCGR